MLYAVAPRRSSFLELVREPEAWNFARYATVCPAVRMSRRRFSRLGPRVASAIVLVGCVVLAPSLSVASGFMLCVGAEGHAHLEQLTDACCSNGGSVAASGSMAPVSAGHEECRECTDLVRDADADRQRETLEPDGSPGDDVAPGDPGCAVASVMSTSNLSARASLRANAHPGPEVTTVVQRL